MPFFVNFKYGNLVLEAFNIKNMYVSAVSMQLNMNWVGTKYL